MLWSVELSKAEGNKVIKPWIGPYRVKEKLGSVGYILESEVGGKVARSHAKRLRRIGDQVAVTGNSADGVFLDSLRTVKKISGEETRRNEKTGELERHFKVQLLGRRSPRWTPESELPEVVVRLNEISVSKGIYNPLSQDGPDSHWETNQQASDNLQESDSRPLQTL